MRKVRKTTSSKHPKYGAGTGQLSPKGLWGFETIPLGWDPLITKSETMAEDIVNSAMKKQICAQLLLRQVPTEQGQGKPPGTRVKT